MYKVTLSKVRGGEGIRTDVTKGTTSCYPSVGKSFHMYAKPIDHDAIFRTISTSPVDSITRINEHTVEITTANSVYRVEFDQDDYPMAENEAMII